MTRVLNAMREDVSDLRSDAGAGFDEMRSGFIEIRGRLDAAAAGQEQIAGMLSALISRDEEE